MEGSYTAIQSGLFDILKKMSELHEQMPDLSYEAGKNALALPLIKLLGYDIFNPKEVLPSGFRRVDGSFINDHFILKKASIPQMIVCYSMLPPLDQTCEEKENYSVIIKEHARNADVRVVLNIHKWGLRFWLLPSKDTPNENSISILSLISPLPDIENVRTINRIPEYATTTALINNFILFRKENFNLKELIKSKFVPRLKEIIQAELEMPSEEFVKHYADLVYQQVYKENLPQERLKEFQEYVAIVLDEIFPSRKTTQSSSRRTLDALDYLLKK